MKNGHNISNSCILITAVWLVGLIIFLAGSTFAIFIFNKLYIDQAYYYLFEVLLNGDSNKYAANFGILLMICMFITSIIIYLVLKFLLFKIPKLKLLENYFYSNLKLLNKCMTVGVVFFGFFPLYLSLVKVDGDLTKEINVLVLLFSAGFFVPYVSLLLESIYRILVKENEEIYSEGAAKKRNDIPSLGDAEEKGGRVLSDKVNTGKTIGIVHVVYLSIIFIGVVVWLVSYIFSGSSYAGSLLAFAATLSSILLAVIAIIITLIDVAGQRSNIFDVKNSVEELKTVSSDITVFVEEFEIRNKLRDEEMLAIISRFTNDNEVNSKKFDEITDKLDKVSLSGEAGGEIEKIKQEITGMKEKMKQPYLPEFKEFKNNYRHDIINNKGILSKRVRIDSKTGKIIIIEDDE